MPARRIFSAYARRYWEADLSVIPLLKGQKKAFTPNWSQYCERLPQSQELHQWENKFPESNIGLPCGRASGVIAVDIDTDDPELLRQINAIVPPSPVRKRGKKGETRFFRFNGEKSRKFSLTPHGAPVVEILSGGFQTVLPPSIHPETGKPYQWLTPDTLETIRPATLPVLPETVFEQLAALKTGPSPIRSAGSAGKGGRNNRLKDQTVAALMSGKDPDKVADEILRYDTKNHRPPLFSDPAESRMRSKTPAQNAETFVQSIQRSLTRAGIYAGPGKSKPLRLTVYDKNIVVFTGASLAGFPEVTISEASAFGEFPFVLVFAERDTLIEKAANEILGVNPEAELHVLLLPPGLSTVQELLAREGAAALTVQLTGKVPYLHFLRARTPA